MKNIIATVALALTLMGTAYARDKYVYVPNTTVTPEMVHRAADAVPLLRSMMRDPDSFVLEGVYLRESTHKNEKKHANDAPEFCFFFRSHNAYGGYGDTGEALMDEKGTLRIWSLEEQRHLYYEMMACTPKRRLADITTQVNEVLHPAPPVASASTPEEQAAKAQQYADCLKAAVNNHSIVCKP